MGKGTEGDAPFKKASNEREVVTAVKSGIEPLRFQAFAGIEGHEMTAKPRTIRAKESNCWASAVKRIK